MDSTQQITRGSAPRPLSWTLVVAHHGDASSIGHRIVIEQSLTLGRALPVLGDDRRLSRAHAVVEVEGEGLRVRDQASRNGTFVDGARIDDARLQEGSLLGIGGVLMIARRANVLADLPADGSRIAYASFAMIDVRAEVARAASQAGSVLFVGETGVGKGLLAEDLHLARAPNGPFVTLHCASVAESSVHAQLFGEGERPGIVEAAEGGTLFLDGLDDASPALQAALLDVLDRREIRRVGSARARRVELGVVASSRRWPASLRDDFVTRVGGFRIDVPPLRERREDVGAIARSFLALADGEKALHHELALALLRHDWPGNVRELQSVLGRAMLEGADDKGRLRLTDRIAALLDRGHEPEEPAASIEGGHAIARDGAFFEAPDRGRVSLESRKVLQLLLSALARGEGRSLTVNELLLAGWPGERVLPRAGASRVYVSIASLRKMGAPLERTPQGYRVQPGVRIV